MVWVKPHTHFYYFFLFFIHFAQHDANMFITLGLKQNNIWWFIFVINHSHVHALWLLIFNYYNFTGTFDMATYSKPLILIRD